MDEERASRFMFPQTLTEQTRPIGLPMDETIALFAPMGWGFYTGKYVTGLVIAVLLWFCLKYFKKGRGTDWLLNACYCTSRLHSSKVCTKSFPIRHSGCGCVDDLEVFPWT